MYIGVTSRLESRVWQHRFADGSDFTSKYNVDRHVWFEEAGDVRFAIAREKQIKNWRRDWKLALVDEENPDWDDLAEAWFDTRDPESSSG